MLFGLAASQVRSMHTFTAANNPSLYAWAQYYAANPPPEAQQVMQGAERHGFRCTSSKMEL